MGLAKEIDFIFQQDPVAIDSNVFIYALEDNSDFPLAKTIFEEIARRRPQALTSVLTITELTVPLFKTKSYQKIAKYLDFITGKGLITVVAVNQTIALKAAQFRANFNLKTPDAIHLATATASGAGVFVSADRDFKLGSIEGLKIVKI